MKESSPTKRIALTWCPMCGRMQEGVVQRVAGFLDFICGTCKTTQFWGEEKEVEEI